MYDPSNIGKIITILQILQSVCKILTTTVCMHIVKQAYVRSWAVKQTQINSKTQHLLLWIILMNLSLNEPSESTSESLNCCYYYRWCLSWNEP